MALVLVFKKQEESYEIRQRNESKIYLWYQLYLGSLLKNASIISYRVHWWLLQELVKLIEREDR